MQWWTGTTHIVRFIILKQESQYQDQVIDMLYVIVRKGVDLEVCFSGASG